MNGELRDGQIRLLWTARIDYPRGSGVQPHSHADHYQLLVLTEGGGRLFAAGGEFPLESGCRCLIRPGIEHAFVFDADSVSFDYKFAVDDPAVANYMEILDLAAPCGPDALSGLRQTFRLSLASKRQPEPMQALRIDALFKSVLLGLAPQPRGAAAEPWLEASASGRFPMAAYLSERLDRQVTLDELAERFNFHPHYIVHLFKRHAGTTPIRYHQLLRLAKVKELLEFTGLGISEIALRVGWSAPYLSRLFLQEEGMTASDYRSELVQAIDRDIVLDSSFVNKWRIVQGNA